MWGVLTIYAKEAKNYFNSTDMQIMTKKFSTFVNFVKKLVRQQDAYLAIRPAYPRGCCPRAAKGDKTYLQPVFLHR